MSANQRLAHRILVSAPVLLGLIGSLNLLSLGCWGLVTKGLGPGLDNSNFSRSLRGDEGSLRILTHLCAGLSVLPP